MTGPEPSSSDGPAGAGPALGAAGPGPGARVGPHMATLLQAEGGPPPADGEDATGIDALPMELLVRCLRPLLSARDGVASLARAAGASNSFAAAAHQLLQQQETLDLSVRRVPCSARPLDLRSVLRRALLNNDRLQELDLTGGFRFVDDALCAQLAACRPRHLQTLRLDFCEKVTSTGSTALVSAGLASLTALSCRAMPGLAFGPLLASLPELRDLSAPWCRQLTDGELAPMAARLERLNVEGCDSVGDEAVSELRCCATANLAYTGVTDAGLLALAASCPRIALVQLAPRAGNIYNNSRWSDGGLFEIQQMRPDIVFAFVPA